MQYSKYKIYKFDYLVKSRSEKAKEKQHKQLEEFIDFRKKFLNKFSGMTAQERWEKFGLDGREEGIQLVEKLTGILYWLQWRSTYYLIPKENLEAIQFFEDNKPEWVKTVGRL